MSNLFYLKDKGFQTILYYENEEIVENTTYKKVLHNLCLQEFSTLSGRVQAIKEVFGFKYNTPIFVNKKNILVKIPENEYNLWINVYNIVDIKAVNNLNTKIIFVNNSFIIVEQGYKKVSTIIKKGLLIKNKTV